jgi:hypothetical protein
VPQAKWLRALREAEVESERVYTDGQLAAVIDTDDPAFVLAAATQCRDVGELMATLRVRFDESKLEVDEAGRFQLSEAADTRPAETWLLRSLIKQREGFMSRHFERKISLAITRRLAFTRVTPDMMTVVSVGIGLLGALFFCQVSRLPARRGAPVPDALDPRRLRRRGSPSSSSWSRRTAHPRLLGRQRRPSASSPAWPSVSSFAQDATWPLALGALTVTATLGAAASHATSCWTRRSAATRMWIAHSPRRFLRETSSIWSSSCPRSARPTGF